MDDINIDMYNNYRGGSGSYNGSGDYGGGSNSNYGGGNYNGNMKKTIKRSEVEIKKVSRNEQAS